MKQSVFYAILIIAAVIGFIGYSSFFIVDETEQVIITQFGKPVGDPIVEAGLNYKLPFIQQVSYFDKRYLEWDGDATQVPTSDKTFIFVDTYARWEISEPLQFFIRLRDESGGQSRLDDILDGETRNAIASHELLELVRSSNREPEETEELLEELDQLEDINLGRDDIESMILERANERTSDLGIRVLDFRFKRINYVDEVRQRIFERMISERNRISELYRSEGEGEALRIAGEKERELNRIQSEAERESDQIRGRAEAQATSIYAASYNRNDASRELYSFLKTMETYGNTFDDETTVILSTDSEFYKYLMSLE
ncbi:MAG: protease modulator HflC [Balneolales bacterium]